MIKDLATAMHQLPHHCRSQPADSMRIGRDTESGSGQNCRWFTRPGAWLIVVLAVALTVRLALFMAGPAGQIERAMDGQSVRMLELADNLATTGTFGRAGENATIAAGVAQLQQQRAELPPANAHGLVPETCMTPGYPAFVSLFFAAGVDLWAVLVAQCLLSTMGVWFVYEIGRRLIGSAWVGLIAAGVLALHPADVLYASTLSCTTLLSFVLLAGLFLFSLGRSRRPVASVGGAMVIGLATLVHPIMLCFGPLVGLAHLLARRTGRSAVIGLVIAAVSLVPAAGWAMRNVAVGGGLRVSSAGPINSYFHTGGQMKIAIAEGDPQGDWPAAINSQFTELRHAIQAEESVLTAMRRLIFARIIERPDIYAMLRADTMIRFFTDHSVTQLGRLLGFQSQPSGWRGNLLRGDLSSLTIARPGQLAMKIGWTLLNLALAILLIQGLYRAWREGYHTFFWVTALWLGVMVMLVDIHSSERWRVVVMGLQALAVAGTFSPLFERDQQQAYPQSLALIGPANAPMAQARRAA